MTSIRLSTLLDRMYNNYINFYERVREESQKENFLNNCPVLDRLPFGEILKGHSYNEILENLKLDLSNLELNTSNLNNPLIASNVYEFLVEFMYFSAGHDMMFKEKILASNFRMKPLDFIYPLLEKSIYENFNDLSVHDKHPNKDENIEEIKRQIILYSDFSNFLFMLYYSDWMFTPSMASFFDNWDDIVAVTNSSGLTIGDFLRSLIDYKCDKIKDVMNMIKNQKLKTVYMEKIELLRAEKKRYIETYLHKDLPVGYFINHSINDFMHIGQPEGQGRN